MNVIAMLVGAQYGLSNSWCCWARHVQSQLTTTVPSSPWTLRHQQYCCCLMMVTMDLCLMSWPDVPSLMCLPNLHALPYILLLTVCSFCAGPVILHRLQRDWGQHHEIK